MMKNLRWLSFLLLLAMQGLFSTSGAAAEQGRTLVVGGDARTERVAVVIGNSRYPSGALTNPKNDATAIAASLKKLGFDVELKLDASKADMDAIFKRFSAKADKAAVAALFYAGHGIQVNGSNYIVPIDAKPQTERDLKREMLRMDDVIDDMGNAKVKLVFFDACRDNPLSRSFSRGGSRGMAAPVEASGTLISFATKHGNTAADGNTQHSPYTNALLAALEAPAGVEIEQMLRKVQQSVRQTTNGQQEPWRYGSLDGEFYFQAAAPQVDNARIQQEAVDRAIQEAMKRASAQAASEGSLRSAEQQAREREASALAVELAFWDSIKNSTSADDLREYLASYPQGRFAGLARNRIRSMEAASAPVAPPAPAKAPAKPAAPAAVAISRPPAPEATPAPVQLAMTAPPNTTAAAASAAASTYPQAGDSWTYRYVDAWKKDSPRTVVVRVEESEGGRVTDRMSMSGGRGDERTYEGRVELAERALGRDVRIVEMLPYVQGMLQDGLKPGQERSFPDTVISAQSFRIRARMIGQEKVTVPAGTFDAIRVDVLGQNTGGPVQGNRMAVLFTFVHSVWFVPEIRRVVRVAFRSTNSANSHVDDDSLELVSFAVAGQAAQGATAQLAEIAPPRPATAVVGTLAYPRTGDSWTYRYIDAWKKDSPQTIVVKVEESEGGRVSDKMSLRGGRGADERSYEGKVDAAERALGHDVRIIELLPYVQAILQGGLTAGMEKELPKFALGGQDFRTRIKFVGPEKITVPAGTFDAVRLEIVGQREGGSPSTLHQQQVVTSISHTLWFAPEVRRVVKVQHKSASSFRPHIDDDSLELVSFSLR